MYLTVTGLDIAYNVQTLSQFMQHPNKSYMDVALRIIRYLKRKQCQGLLLSSNKKDSLTAYCDVDWASCVVPTKSITGFTIKLGDSLISWKSKKHATISRS